MSTRFTQVSAQYAHRRTVSTSPPLLGFIPGRAWLLTGLLCGVRASVNRAGCVTGVCMTPVVTATGREDGDDELACLVQGR
jgi:hypothetical protein